jgi:signal transduction histidine kinase
MNLSRARSPEERPSTNTSIGRVLFDDPNVRLIQKTDRSGFIETDTFVEIRRFAKDALDWMANRRLEEAEKRRAMARVEAPRRTDESKKQLDAAVEKLPKAARTPIRKAVDQAWHSVTKEIGEYQREVQLYRTLSTAGITSATFAHESAGESAGNPIKVIDQSILAIERRAKKHCGEVYEQQLKQPIQGIIRAIRGLSVLGNATLRLLDHEKRRPARVDIHDVINNVLETFEPFFGGRDIKVMKDLCPGSPFLRGSEAAIESIVTNLINNSVAAFERSESKDRQMQIQTIFMDSVLRLRVADNGPGIVGINVRDIWLPGRTTRKNGTGLGLTIVRDTVKDLGGDVEAEANGGLGGAEILIDLPILGV